MNTPTIEAADQACRVMRGARIAVAISHNNAAAINIRTPKNVSGPASLVAYRATTKPVLHSATKIAGAILAKDSCRVSVKR
jgi:hypothetical protein